MAPETARRLTKQFYKRLNEKGFTIPVVKGYDFRYDPEVGAIIYYREIDGIRYEVAIMESSIKYMQGEQAKGLKHTLDELTAKQYYQCFMRKIALN